MAKKIKLPNELLSTIDESTQIVTKEKKEIPETFQKRIDKVRKQKEERQKEEKQVEEKRVIVPIQWDVKIGDPIEYFDANLSYEITGYRPITETKGLDFDPDWFTETRETYRRTGHYCDFRFGTKPYNDFWKEQYRRCREGYTVNGYTITGDNYFFLNFYTLPVIDQNKKSASGTSDDFPIFFASQYAFFHYFEIAKRLHLHAALMKARSIKNLSLSIIIQIEKFRNIGEG